MITVRRFVGVDAENFFVRNIEDRAVDSGGRVGLGVAEGPALHAGVAGERVGTAGEAAAERPELDVRILERAVGEKLRHICNIPDREVSGQPLKQSPDRVV